jgi:hypothetical protein
VDVLFVPGNIDTLGKKSDDLAAVAAGAWNGVFLLRKDRGRLHTVAALITFVATGGM